MGRKLAFDRDQALQTAMESFWSNGYEDTSMRDLAGKLGLHLGSVYNTLGSKEQVFEDALRLHLNHDIRPSLQNLRETPEPFTALCDLLTTVAKETTEPGASLGCFITNSLHEITNINEKITALVHAYLKENEDALTICIRRAQEQGDISTDQDATKLANFVSATLFAMRTMSKIGAGGVNIDNIRDCAIQSLKGQSKPLT